MEKVSYDPKKHSLAANILVVLLWFLFLVWMIPVVVWIAVGALVFGPILKLVLFIESKFLKPR